MADNHFSSDGVNDNLHQGIEMCDDEKEKERAKQNVMTADVPPSPPPVIVPSNRQYAKASFVRLRWYICFVFVFVVSSIVSPYVFLAFVDPGQPQCVNFQNESMVVLDAAPTVCQHRLFQAAQGEANCYANERPTATDMQRICIASDCCLWEQGNLRCTTNSSSLMDPPGAGSSPSQGLLLISASWAGTLAIASFLAAKGRFTIYLLLTPIIIVVLWLLLPIKLNDSPNYTFFTVVISGSFNLICGMYDWRFFRLFLPSISDSSARIAAALVIAMDVLLQMLRGLVDQKNNVLLSIVFVCIAYQWFYVVFYFHTKRNSKPTDDTGSIEKHPASVALTLTVLVWFYIGYFLYVTHFTVVFFFFANSTGSAVVATIFYVVSMRLVGVVIESLGSKLSEQVPKYRLKITAMIAYLNGLYYYVFYFNLFTHITHMTTFVLLHSLDLGVALGSVFWAFSPAWYGVENRVRRALSIAELGQYDLHARRNKFYIDQKFTQLAKFSGIISLAISALNMWVGINNDFYASEFASKTLGIPRYVYVLWFAFLLFLMELSMENCTRKWTLTVIQSHVKTRRATEGAKPKRKGPTVLPNKTRPGSFVIIKRAKRNSLHTQSVLEYEGVAKGLRTLMKDWEFLNSCVIWNIIVVMDLHIASRSIRWDCEKKHTPSAYIAIGTISLVVVAILCFVHFSKRCRLGHGKSQRKTENGPLGLFLPYISVERTSRKKKLPLAPSTVTPNKLWVNNPMHLQGHS